MGIIMATVRNTGEDVNSIFLIGGVSIVVLGGLVYWFLNKSEKEEEPISNAEIETTTATLVDDKPQARRNKKKKNQVVEEAPVFEKVPEPVVQQKVEDAPKKSKGKNKKKNSEPVEEKPVVVETPKTEPQNKANLDEMKKAKQDLANYLDEF